MRAEIRWDAPSRFGTFGRLARRSLQRALQPALVRQAVINSELSDRLASAQQQITTLQQAAGRPGDLGDLQYRTDVLERRYELAQARSLLPGVMIPREGERATIVAHDWQLEEERRVLCSNATGVRRRSGDPLAHVDSREDLPLLFNRLGLIGVGVEIGVQTGNYSAWILHRWAGARLISIDPWRTDDPDAYVDVANVEQRRPEELFDSTRHRLAPFGERSAIWRMTGEEAVAHVGAASLDFVYLDARHDTAAIAEDLDMWAPKLGQEGSWPVTTTWTVTCQRASSGSRRRSTASSASVAWRFTRRCSIGRGLRGGSSAPDLRGRISPAGTSRRNARTPVGGQLCAWYWVREWRQ